MKVRASVSYNASMSGHVLLQYSGATPDEVVRLINDAIAEHAARGALVDEAVRRVSQQELEKMLSATPEPAEGALDRLILDLRDARARIQALEAQAGALHKHGSVMRSVFQHTGRGDRAVVGADAAGRSMTTWRGLVLLALLCAASPVSAGPVPCSPKIVSAWSDVVVDANYVQAAQRREDRRADRMRRQLASYSGPDSARPYVRSHAKAYRDSLRETLDYMSGAIFHQSFGSARRYWWCDECGNVWTAFAHPDSAENAPPREPVFRFNLWGSK